MLLWPKGEKQYPNRRRPDQIALTLLAVGLSLTLLAIGLCENGIFQTEGGGRALNLVVWSRLGSQTIFFSVTIIEHTSVMFAVMSQSLVESQVSGWYQVCMVLTLRL